MHQRAGRGSYSIQFKSKSTTYNYGKNRIAILKNQSVKNVTNLKVYHKNKQISEYASENLAYATIEECLKQNKFKENSLSIACHVPLKNIIKICKDRLTEKEFMYANNICTHVDFLIYNSITRKPLFPIEIDGESFHSNPIQKKTR